MPAELTQTVNLPVCKPKAPWSTGRMFDSHTGATPRLGRSSLAPTPLLGTTVSTLFEVIVIGVSPGAVPIPVTAAALTYAPAPPGTRGPTKVVGDPGSN